jgi:hypothetical protein
MTKGSFSPGTRTRAEMLDAALAFGVLDDALAQLRAVAASSAEQHAHCENDGSETLSGVLASWANSNAAIAQALALLEHANQLLVPPTRPIGIEITRPGRMNQEGNQRNE